MSEDALDAVPGEVRKVHDGPRPGGHPLFLLRPARLRDQGAPLARCGLVNTPCCMSGGRRRRPAGVADSERDLPARAAVVSTSSAAKLGFTEAGHFVFPVAWAQQAARSDAEPMTSWRTAWRSMRKAAGLTHVRFHDGRHTAITTLAEKGLPDWVIQAQVGHVAPEMMKTYSHIRRQALNQAAAALEPTATDVPRRRRTATSGDPAGTRRGLCHSPCHKTAVGEGECSNLLRKVAPQAGLEPATLRLTAGCSAIELLRNRGGRAPPPDRSRWTPIVAKQAEAINHR